MVTTWSLDALKDISRRLLNDSRLKIKQCWEIEYVTLQIHLDGNVLDHG